MRRLGLAIKPAHCSTFLPPAVIIQTLGNVSGASGQETGRRRDNSNKTLDLKKMQRKGKYGKRKKRMFCRVSNEDYNGKIVN